MNKTFIKYLDVFIQLFKIYLESIKSDIYVHSK